MVSLVTSRPEVGRSFSGSQHAGVPEEEKLMDC